MQDVGFLLTQKIACFTQKTIWDAKVEMLYVPGTQKIDSDFSYS